MEKEHDLAKWLSGEMTAEELQAFEKSPEFDSYQRIAKYSVQLDAPEFDNEPILRKIIMRKKTALKVISPQRKWMLRIAAIFIIALGSLFFFQTSQAVSKTALAGMKTRFALPDDSEVVLNSGSEIRYKKKSWKNHRDLDLDGEAFFKVSKGERFTVRTNLGNVTVVGTQFNVKARKKRFEAECFEGRVIVSFGNESRLITKGEIIVVEDGQVLYALPTYGRTPSWMDKQMRIISLPLKAILPELERTYAIRIDGSNIKSDQKFTGFLPANDLVTALEIISKTYNFNYKVTSRSSVVLIAR